MAKGVLHRSRAEEFLRWCRERGMETRDGRGLNQIAQIRPRGAEHWMCIYDSKYAPEHYTVNSRLNAQLFTFIHETKPARAQQRTKENSP